MNKFQPYFQTLYDKKYTNKSNSIETRKTISSRGADSVFAFSIRDRPLTIQPFSQQQKAANKIWEPTQIVHVGGFQPQIF